MHAHRAVLIVDTDPAMHELVHSSLPTSHWDIEFAAGPSEALSRLGQRSYDLVITGPRTSASQDVLLLRRMRAVRPHLKMIVLTEQSTPAEVIASIRAHAFSHLSEPLDRENLAQIIAQALEEPSWDDGIDVLSARPEWISLRLKCKKVTAERLEQFMEELRTGLPEKERTDIATAFREMLLNAIEHGGHFDPENNVDVTRIRTPGMILYLIRDPGEGFSFDSLPQAAVSNPADSPFNHELYRDKHGMRPGGFGILMTKGLVDQLVYNEKGNEVLLIKKLADGMSPKEAPSAKEGRQNRWRGP
jgi:anti-sigma regulatory factor (Ser/Thr protein kinase)/CheY-like chemotaxis protein